MSKHVLVERHDTVLKIELNRPEKLNALLVEMYQAVADALKVGDEDTAVHVIYITGRGKAFTSGNDLNDFLQNPPSDENSPVTQFLRNISQAKKPIVTAVNGIAVGVGATMLLHSDLVYAADSAKLQFPFVDLALVPEAASTYIMPRLMGHPKAAELLLLCEMIDANQAQEVGVVNKVLPANELQAFAWQKAQALAQKPPQAVQITKQLLRRHPASEIATAMNAEAEHFRARLVSDEVRQVIASFFQK